MIGGGRSDRLHALYHSEDDFEGGVDARSQYIMDEEEKS
jgi:hypothetical protein